MTKIELLAPANNKTTGIKAIQCGADAVYIGAPLFGARETASNSIEDIKKLADFAHFFSAKVYIAMNTILTDDEIYAAEALIEKLPESKVDGLIIQDMGFLELNLPPIPLIASTQTNNMTPEKVKFLEDAGFSRVILARELSLSQIEKIRKETTVELECFVHGALCVGFSGQCYMSYALGGRSGNRGQCAQPCRKEYRLINKKGVQLHDYAHLLSLKDLNLSHHIGDLLDLGITSFKIEGRLKNDAYVANNVAHYHNLINAEIQKRNLTRSSCGTVKHNFAPDPEKTFNRGYTEYNINGKVAKAGSIQTPKSLGEMIGKVKTVDSRKFILNTKKELSNGDGICFFDTNRKLQGTTINKVEGSNVYPQKIKGLKAGTVIYRNLNHSFSSLLKKNPAERKIPVTIIIDETEDGLLIKGIDQCGLKTALEVKTTKEPAKNQDAASDNLKKQFAKLGQSPFKCREIKINLKQPFFFPKSALNEMRRSLISQMETARKNAYTSQEKQTHKTTHPYPEYTLDYHANILNRKAKTFYKKHGVTKTEPAAETGRNLQGKLIMQTKYCLRYQLNMCSKNSQKEALYIEDKEGNRFKVRFRCNDCGMDIYLE